MLSHGVFYGNAPDHPLTGQDPLVTARILASGHCTGLIGVHSFNDYFSNDPHRSVTSWNM